MRILLEKVSLFNLFINFFIHIHNDMRCRRINLLEKIKGTLNLELELRTIDPM